jgi:hypothetical protein
MAKPPGERTKFIRQAITDHPRLGNTELAGRLNEEKPGHDIKPDDIAKQKLAMRKLAGKGATRKRKAQKAPAKSEPRREEPPAKTPPAEKPAPVASGLNTGDLASLLALVRKVGGVDSLMGYLEVLRNIR